MHALLQHALLQHDPPHHDPMDTLPQHADGIAAFIAAFEHGTLPKQRWTHAAHILTGAWYVHGLGEEAATAAMRTAVSRYNLAVGGKNTATSGYHETITVFWIKVLAALHRAINMQDRATFAVAAVRRLGARRALHEGFYTFDVIASEHARREWIEPAKPIEFANL